MEERDVIHAQLDALGRELSRALDAVDSEQRDGELRRRVAPRFATELAKLQQRRKELEAEVLGRGPLRGSWSGLRTLQRDAAGLFDECLAFIQGAWARQHELDEGICELTDALLDDLAESADIAWGRFTLLATSELFRPTAGIIRIRYPEISIWSLPLAAHELGHYLGPELRRGDDGGREYPFQARLKLADEGSLIKPHAKEWHHVQEYFADTFATYTLGPAYAAAFILLRMNPADAHAETLTHPSAAARVHGILWTLERMDRRDAGDPRTPLGDVTEWLRAQWQAGLAAAGEERELPGANAVLVTQRMGELFDMLAGTTDPKLQLGRGDWGRALDIAGDLAAKAPSDELTRREVLNAAWLARIRLGGNNPHVLNDLTRNALALYRSRAPRPSTAATAPGG